jgi:hypothetical protein
MGPSNQRSDLEDILNTLRRFLSDEIPPLNAADAVLQTLYHPPLPIAEEIRNWVAVQNRRAGNRLRVADLVFHALKKLNETAELKLVPADLMADFLRQLKPLVISIAPPQDQEELRIALDTLERAPTSLEKAIGFVHRPMHPGGAEAVGEAGGAAASGNARTEDPRENRFSALLDRIQVQQTSPAAPQGEQVSEVVALAAAEARDRSELSRIQAALPRGKDPAEVFKLLTQSLPAWVLPPAPEGHSQAAPAENMALHAMSQFVRLAQSRTESEQRFEAMVQAAIEQFNEGSLARAVTMLESCGNLLQEGTVDQRAVDNARSSAHEMLSQNRLRRYAEQQEKHHLLRRVLGFFAEFAPEAMLDQLQTEQKRDRRRLLLNLLEAQGTPARAAALARLRDVVDSADPEHWYFARNLLCILGRIPRVDESSVDEETSLSSSYLDIARPAPLVREAIAFLGQAKNERAEQYLVAALQRIENRLLERNVADHEAGRLRSLLDRLASVLGRGISSAALTALVDHGLRRQFEFGDTLVRVASLGGRDLAAEPKIVEKLLQALRTRTPRKVLGVTFQKDIPGLLNIIKALSSTPLPAVEEALRQLGDRFPEEEFGKAAAQALRAFRSGQFEGESAATDRLYGDLELFGLPELLHQLIRNQVSGTLTLKDQSEDVAGTLTLSGGRMSGCRAGMLEGRAALYNLLARPVAGTFSFIGHKSQGKTPSRPQGEDLVPLIIEGMKRHDELQRARTMVPDGARVAGTGSEPTPRPDEEDPLLFQRIWQCAGAGARVEDCERESKGDPDQVRLLLARWLEDGHLTMA